MSTQSAGEQAGTWRVGKANNPAIFTVDKGDVSFQLLSNQGALQLRDYLNTLEQRYSGLEEVTELAKLEAEGRQARIANLEAELARCGKENCMGLTVAGVASWVRKERLEEVQQELAREREKARLTDEAVAFLRPRDESVSAAGGR